MVVNRKSCLEPETYSHRQRQGAIDLTFSNRLGRGRMQRGMLADPRCGVSEVSFAQELTFANLKFLIGNFVVYQVGTRLFL